jgi:hypothetical protein
MLLWSDLGVEGKATVSYNKVVVWCHRLMRRCGASKLSLAGLGGEGRKWTGALGSTAGRWRGSSLLRFGEYHTVTKSAAVICDRTGGLSRRQIGISSTSMVAAPTGDSP